MSNVDVRFALVDPANGHVFFPYQKSRDDPPAYGFALSSPGKQDRGGEGTYTTDIAEVIRRVVIHGWKVRSKLESGTGEGSRGINKKAKLNYWVAPEFLHLVKDEPTRPLAALPGRVGNAEMKAPSALQAKALAAVEIPQNPRHPDLTPGISISFTSEQTDEAATEAMDIAGELVGFDGADQEVVAKRRINQGKFRKILLCYWANRCCVSDVADVRLLVASHIVPWSKATNSEQGDPANGLLLSVSWDALFDRGLVAFRDDGSAILERLDHELLTALGIDESKSTISPSRLTTRHREYLERHRQLFGFAQSAN